MFASLQARLIALGATMLLLISAYAWVHHQGAAAQKKADQAVIAEQGHALVAASQSLNAANIALRAANTAVKENQNAADEAKARADDAKREAADAKQALDDANSAWQARFKTAQGAKGCETLKEELCPAVMSY